MPGGHFEKLRSSLEEPEAAGPPAAATT